MSELVITAAARVTEADLHGAKLGPRFGRIDLASRLSLLAVEMLGVKFEAFPRERIGICLSVRAGSLSTDIEFWNGRNGVGGPSPTLFAYTLPSAAIGEIAIRHRLTGPNLCLVDDGGALLTEAADMLRRNEADACLCVSCQAITPVAAEMTGTPAVARACALFLQRGGPGMMALRENDRDIETLCAKLSGLIRPNESNHASIAPRVEGENN